MKIIKNPAFGRKRYLTSFYYFLLNLIFANVCFGQTNDRAYNQTLTSGSQPAGISMPRADYISNSANFTNLGLVLTTGTNQFGAVLLDGVEFDSTNGLDLSFEYSMYGGQTADGKSGDGISFFLYDASILPVNIGGIGGALGYSYSAGSKGLSGAYLGIGLDEFGNFKGVEWPVRKNGIRNVSWHNDGASHITLRGAMRPNGNQYSGYPVLITQSTKDFTDSGTSGLILDPKTGNYTALPRILSNNSFPLRPGALSVKPGDGSYRKVFITLLPNAAGGFNITLKIQFGTSTTTVIDNYHYPSSLKYYENAETIPGVLTDLVANIPSKFKIGFAASTGLASQTQLIRNLSIKFPFHPVTAPDIISCCGNYDFQVTVNPFANDKFYDGALSGIPIGGNDNSVIDFSTFRFEDISGNSLGISYTDLNKGTWAYADGIVSFIPARNFVGTSTVYYSAKGTASKGGPYKQDNYRSVNTPISATVVKCNSISNPQISSKTP